MNVAVIGLGSMGKRRIRIIQELYPDYEICGVDGREDRRTEAKETYGIKCYDSISSVDRIVNCAFVCTAPLSHAAIITECLNNGWNVFTELNLLDDGYEENIRLAEEKKCKLFLSSTFLYREEISYIRSRIEPNKKWNYIYHIGQYLPDWHPWENYNDYFIGNPKTNGCREILAIELPWITHAFGEIKKIHAVSDKMTDLKIAYNDNYLIQLEHAGGNKGVLIVDVVSPCAVRKLEVYAENRYLSWDGKPDSLLEFNESTKAIDRVVLNEVAEHQEGYSAFVVENAYKNEIKEFFDVVNAGKTATYGFEQDKQILRIIDSIGA